MFRFWLFMLSQWWISLQPFVFPRTLCCLLPPLPVPPPLLSSVTFISMLNSSIPFNILSMPISKFHITLEACMRPAPFFSGDLPTGASILQPLWLVLPTSCRPVLVKPPFIVIQGLPLSSSYITSSISWVSCPPCPCFTPHFVGAHSLIIPEKGHLGN